MDQISKEGFAGTAFRKLRGSIFQLSFFGLLIIITGSINLSGSRSANCLSKSGKDELVKLVLNWEKQYATPPSKEQIEELVGTFSDENAASSERVVLFWETMK